MKYIEFEFTRSLLFDRHFHPELGVSEECVRPAYNVVMAKFRGFERHVDLQDGAPDEFKDRTWMMLRLTMIMGRFNFVLAGMEESVDREPDERDSSTVMLSFTDGDLHALAAKHPELKTDATVTEELLIALKGLQQGDTVVVGMPLNLDILNPPSQRETL